MQSLTVKCENFVNPHLCVHFLLDGLMNTEIFYTTTDDGTLLAIVDVTNPAFTATATDAELAEQQEKFILTSKQRQQMSAEITQALQSSVLGRGLIAASGTFLSGINTYMFKLGPDNLGANANPIDKQIAASFPAFTMRLRLQDMARMLADALAPLASANPLRPICFINIAGGPAADTWNTLIHLQQDHPGLLANRKISIAVLDLDTHGPSFGRRALDTLRASGAPLHGIDIQHQHLTYEWTQTDRLPDILASLHTADSLCAISSEGGLFEYGSDEQIIANLKQLHANTPHDSFVVGTVTRDAETIRAAHVGIQIVTRPRTLKEFHELATHSGWAIQHVIERPMSFNLRLVKAPHR